MEDQKEPEGQKAKTGSQPDPFEDGPIKPESPQKPNPFEDSPQKPDPFEDGPEQAPAPFED